MNLEDRMLVCLEIMSMGDDMPGIGNWTKTLEEMERLGYCRRVGADFRITAEGEDWYAENQTDLVEQLVRDAKEEAERILKEAKDAATDHA